ncbi:proline dehydrogenase family protein [Phytohabitans kaempferiae]|uniref:proline dehydrogenase n=1 Tax=Phytohabitans kaempferiae TaxID=1620943 RepID=A0ABV6MDX6_9ACTN
MLRSALLAASRSTRFRKTIEGARPLQPVIARFVAGVDTGDALQRTADLLAAELSVTLDYLGEETRDVAQVERTVAVYERLLAAFGDCGFGRLAEVSVKLSAVGQSLGVDGNKRALEAAHRICVAAQAAGTTVTLDMEDHTTTDATLEVLRALRVDFPWVGVALQAYLHRTEGDCRDLVGAGSRVRLCKGAYAEPASVAYRRKAEVDRSYIRCLRVLMAGNGYPMVATHDPRIVAVADVFGEEFARLPVDHEFQMLYGVRTREQQRIAERGNVMRVYVPFGDDWYGYFMRRLAERPANLLFFARALVKGR